MGEELWVIRAKKSSDKQSRFFGAFGAYRPYILIRGLSYSVMSDELIKKIINASFEDAIVIGIEYKKFFNLEYNSVFEFDYARAYRRIGGGYDYERFIKIKA